MKKLQIFADCASYHNGKPDQIGSFSTLIVDENNNILKRIDKVFMGTTNNFNEVMGVLAGLEYALNNYPDVKSFEIISDSQYCIYGVNKWLAGWVRKGWKGSSGKVVENLQLWKTMHEFIGYANRNRKVLKFLWVKGHPGKNITIEEDSIAYFQEMCDTRAVKVLKVVVDKVLFEISIKDEEEALSR